MVFLQKFISFLTSLVLNFYPVVINIAPSDFESIFKYYTIEICSSEVPGGVSTIKKSNSSQSTSDTNYYIKAFFLGPLQITAES